MGGALEEQTQQEGLELRESEHPGSGTIPTQAKGLKGFLLVCLNVTQSQSGKGKKGPASSHCASGRLAGAHSLCSGVLRYQENRRF